jgi:hypothetical protein
MNPAGGGCECEFAMVMPATQFISKTKDNNQFSLFIYLEMSLRF